jgi:autotransporter-associated beta strand protein
MNLSSLNVSGGCFMKKHGKYVAWVLAALYGMATVASIAQAGTLTWSNGDGTWNTTNTNWGGSAWSSGADASFASPAGTVTVSGNISGVNSITFATDGYLLTGTGVLNITGTSGVNGGANIATGAGTDTIGCAINSTTARLNKTGAGTLVLSGANTINNGISVEAGTLSVGTIADSGSSNIGGGNAFLGIENASTFQYTGTTNATTNRSIYLGDRGGAVLNVSQSGVTLTLAPSSGGVYGAFTKTGAGTLVLGDSTHANILLSGSSVAVNGGAMQLASSNSGYSGTTTLTAGTLSFVSGGLGPRGASHSVAARCSGPLETRRIFPTELVPQAA